jgi:hypothetical protein
MPVFYQRTMNSFAVLEWTDDPQIAAVPVIPGFHKRDDEDDESKYYLVGFATPLTDGARRASRAVAGFTPLYQNKSHPDLWQMQTRVVVAKVKTPYMGKISFFGCE